MEASSAEHVPVSRTQAKPTFDIFEIGYNDLPGCWEQIAPMVEKACAESHGAFDPRSVVDGMREGEYIMLGIVSDRGDIPSVLVCCVGVLPTGARVFEVLLCGGEGMNEWLPYEHRMDEFARYKGCQRVRAIGRKSLLKKLPHWKAIGVMLEREI